MKKHLIAAAVAAAVAVPAMAQVTISGALDTGYSSQKLDSFTSTSQTKTSGFGLASGIATSRIRFAGTEDLGSGMKASFALEQQLNITQSQDLLGSGTTSREASLALSTGVGTLKIGRFTNIGKVMKDSHTAYGGGVGTGQGGATVAGLSGSAAQGLAGFADANGTAVAAADVTAFGLVSDRNNNLINYTSPNFNGFEVQAEMRLNSVDNQNADRAGKQETSGQAFRLSYANGPLTAAIAQTNYKAKTEGSAAVTGSSGLCVDVSETSATNGVKLRAVNATTACTAETGDYRWSGVDPVAATPEAETKFGLTQLGGTYDFGVAKAFLSYMDGEIKPTGAAKADVEGYDLSVSVPVGAITLLASFGESELKSGANKYTVDSYYAQGRYSLSKRTTAYVLYGQNKYKTTGTSDKDNLTMIGVAHTF